MQASCGGVFIPIHEPIRCRADDGEALPFDKTSWHPDDDYAFEVERFLRVIGMHKLLAPLIDVRSLREYTPYVVPQEGWVPVTVSPVNLWYTATTTFCAVSPFEGCPAILLYPPSATS